MPLAAEILGLLDAAKFPITVAMWLFERERDEWTLIVATPLYDQLGAHKAYLRLIEILSVDGPVALSDLPIRLESARRPMIKALRKMFGKATPVSGMRLGHQSVGGVWIDDAYIYRIKK